jgi:hypothetical protein
MVRRIPVFAFVIAAYGETRRDNEFAEVSRRALQSCDVPARSLSNRLRVASEVAAEPTEDAAMPRPVEAADAK